MSLDSFAELRGSMDGREPFMTQGHQIIKPRKYKKRIPDWARNDTRLREIVLRSFPKLKTDPKQRARAARWIRVAHLYFRMGMSRGEIAYELGSQQDDGSIKPVAYSTIDTVIRSVKRAAMGMRADGKGPNNGRTCLHRDI